MMAIFLRRRYPGLFDGQRREQQDRSADYGIRTAGEKFWSIVKLFAIMVGFLLLWLFAGEKEADNEKIWSA